MEIHRKHYPDETACSFFSVATSLEKLELAGLVAHARENP